MTFYPPPPQSFADIPNGLEVAWDRAWSHIGVVDWIMAGEWPQLELETGHDRLCTARYDAEADCVELEGCVLLDVEEIPAPRCTPRCWHHGRRWLG
jgi:hypothetical protein